ncbi:MAG: amino acid adenylation domain-containing protein, partial [bacterium]|nr:amino acid adenylation domain-containing protein [bacterium]
AKLFKEETINRYVTYFRGILQAVAAAPGIKISEIEIISQKEKNQILYEFNDTATQYPTTKTLRQLFEEQVRRTPHNAALSGENAERLNTVITYSQLNERAAGVAAILREKNIRTGDIVAIKARRTIELIVGIMGILKAGAAYLPLNAALPAQRIRYMLKDSNARILLRTAEEIKEKTEIKQTKEEAQKIRETETKTKAKTKAKTLNRLEESLEIEEVQLNRIKTAGRKEQEKGQDETGEEKSPQYPSAKTQPHSANLAYVIYTSGSTGKPKGVMVSHRALVNFLYGMKRTFADDFGSRDRSLSLTAITFDVSVAELFLPLTFGSTLELMEDEQIFDVDKLAAKLVERAITFAYIPPALLKRVNERLRQQPGKVALNKLLVGVEAITDEQLEAYLHLKPDMIIVNAYGPTETTICATAGQYRTQPTTGKNVTIGAPLPNYAIYILDKTRHPVPIGITGELHIAGDGLAQGYLNNPELTAQRFVKTSMQYAVGSRQEKKKQETKEDKKNTGREKTSSIQHQASSIFYSTGDQARWLPDGRIEFRGRIDQQVKIRGYRIEPGEIEKELQEHRQVKQAVVTVNEAETGEKYLSAYVVPAPPHTRDATIASTLKTHLAGSLPQYMIPTFIMEIDTIPLTTSGKIDTKALPRPGRETGETLEKPRDAVEKQIAEIWAQVLGIREDRVGVETNFFDQGGHSLKATILAARLHEKTNSKVPLLQIFKTPTIRALAKYIKAGVKEHYAAIQPVEKREYYALSSAQKRLYILQQMEPESLSYNMHQRYAVPREIDKKHLEAIFKKLIVRHESLRTSFHTIDGTPVQRIAPPGELQFSIAYHETIEDANTGIDSHFGTFDITRPPLFRVALVESKNGERKLLLNMHHIISDGTSQALMIEEYKTIAGGGDLAPLRLQYKDYALWQNSGHRQARVKKQETFWVDRFAGEIPMLELPADYPRPAIRSTEGKRTRFQLDENKAKELGDIARENNATLFMIILSSFTILLSKLSG